MTDFDREKWDKRYREGSYQARTHGTELLVKWLPRLPPGRALDVACGAGRNALRLARAGYRVDAMDISAAALARGQATAEERQLSVNWIDCDLDHAPMSPAGYEVVVVARYVNRALFPRLREAVKEGGYIIYEHHMTTSRVVDGPKDPEFRLRPNELLDLFRDFRVLFYHEGLMDDADGRTMALAQLVACKGSPDF